MSSTDSTNDLPFPLAANTAFSAKPSEIEREVMALLSNSAIRCCVMRSRLAFRCMMRKRSCRKCSFRFSGIFSYAGPARTFVDGFFAWRIISR